MDIIHKKGLNNTVFCLPFSRFKYNSSCTSLWTFLFQNQSEKSTEDIAREREEME